MAGASHEGASTTAMERSITNVRALKMRVEGMDCSACGIKIENTLKRFPGVSDINVNHGAETLVLRDGPRESDS